jgi:hypothetical protein
MTQTPTIPASACFRTTPGTLWSAQAGGVIVGDHVRNDWMQLAYPEAAVWDLLARGRSIADTAGRVRWIAGLSPEAAQTLVQGCADRWLRENRIRQWPTSP